MINKESTEAASLAKQLYPNHDFRWWPSSYQPIIDYIIGDILIQVDDDDYQGDSRILCFKDGKYGILIFGWGSCSGCDALQSCNSEQEVNDLIESLESSVKWFESKEEVYEYITTKDWKLDFCYNAAEFKAFMDAAIKVVKPE